MSVGSFLSFGAECVDWYRAWEVQVQHFFKNKSLEVRNVCFRARELKVAYDNYRAMFGVSELSAVEVDMNLVRFRADGGCVSVGCLITKLN